MNVALSHLHHAPPDRSRPLAQTLFRSAAAHVVAFARNVPVNHAAEKLFGDDASLKRYLLAQKAAVEPALTSVPEWAGNLVRETWDEYLELLLPESVFAQVAAIGTRNSFEAGKVRVAARDTSVKLAGDFIGENAPIPVRKASFKATSLTPKKLAVISAFSGEMSTASGRVIESAIRQAMLEDSAALLDQRLLDAVAANAIRPAGLLNGVTLTPSAGDTLADIITDIKAALAPILTAGGGRRLVWLMNPLQALTLALQVDAAGAFVWGDVDNRFVLGRVIVSVNVPVGTLIVLDGADFATAADEVPQFVVSKEALLHADDAATGITSGASMSSPVISMFQQDGFAVRMIQQVNWTMRRTGMVAGVSGIAW